MEIRFTTRDGRLLARFIMLTQRFGCDYREADARQDPVTKIFDARIHFVGNDDALRRLKAQITKILEYEKELV